MHVNEHELWDLYDEQRRPTGRTQKRGEYIKQGDYHLVVNVLLLNSKKELLITKRAPDKSSPNLWEFPGGAAVSGDTSVMAAVREIKEEAGVILDPADGILLNTQMNSRSFFDKWLFKKDVALADIILQEGETVDARWVSFEELLTIAKLGQFIRIENLQDSLEQIERFL